MFELYELEMEIDLCAAIENDPYKGIFEHMQDWIWELEESELDNNLCEFDVFIRHGKRYAKERYPHAKNSEWRERRRRALWEHTLEQMGLTGHKGSIYDDFE